MLHTLFHSLTLSGGDSSAFTDTQVAKKIHKPRVLQYAYTHMHSINSCSHRMQNSNSHFCFDQLLDHVVNFSLSHFTNNSTVYTYMIQYHTHTQGKEERERVSELWKL